MKKYLILEGEKMEDVEKSVEKIVENSVVGSEEAESIDISEDDWKKGFEEAEGLL